MPAMSAADGVPPANPHPIPSSSQDLTPAEATPTVAPVIDLATRAKEVAGPRREAPPVAPTPEQQKVAAFWQAQYARAGLSLVDPDTAETHRVAMGVLDLLVRVSAECGQITSDARIVVAGILRDAQQVPDTL